MPLSLHVIREMERKRGEEGERTKTSRSTTMRNQQQDGKDKRTDRLQRDEGRRMIKWREEDQIRWRGIKGRRGFRERREWAKERGNKGKRWGYIWGMWECCSQYHL